MTEGACGSLDDADLSACLPEWYGEEKVTERLRTS
jgi:hypothetical protein